MVQVMLSLTDTTQRSATISVLVDNESGVLARVIGLFSGRGYNIDSLTVAPVDAAGSHSRINIVTSGTSMIIEQIKAQLDRLVPVHRVADLTMEGPHVARELALVKVIGTGERRVEALRVADTFRARVVDTTLGSFVFELDGCCREDRRIHRVDAGTWASRRCPAAVSRLWPAGPASYHRLKRTERQRNKETCVSITIGMPT